MKFLVRGVTAVALEVGTGEAKAGLLFVSLSDSTIVSYDVSLGSAAAVKASRTVFASGSPLSAPEEMVFDSAGNMYTTNRNGNTVTKITPSGTKSTFASNIGSYGLTADVAGNIYAAAGSVIKRIDQSGSVTTFANTNVSNSPRGLSFETRGQQHNGRLRAFAREACKAIAA